MRRHPLDWLSLLVGLLAVSVAMTALTDLRLGTLISGLGPALALVIGVAILVAAFREPTPQATPDHSWDRTPAADEARDARADDADDAATREIGPASAATDRS